MLCVQGYPALGGQILAQSRREPPTTDCRPVDGLAISTTSCQSVIEFQRVSKRYPGGQIGLDDVSFRIDAGEFVVLTGPSGAGKTTLLRLIYRGDLPTSGVVLVDGRNIGALPKRKIPHLRRSIGVVFQDFRLIARKTVFENISYLPRILGADQKKRKQLAYEALKRVGLSHRFRAFPEQLSGGEQQRVAIARALISSPKILLADEPTGNLDPQLSREIFKLFHEIHAQGTTLLIATHDPMLIDGTALRQLELERGSVRSGAYREAVAPASDLRVGGAKGRR